MPFGASFMNIVHISDSHGARGHAKVIVPSCDVLAHSGDIGGRTNLLELTEFLIWFEKQPARKKIWIAGNHDVILDSNYIHRKKRELDSVAGMLLEQAHRDALSLLKNYDVTYLNNSGCTFEGVKFWGSPYSPSFHREHWAFNADRGEEIKKIWAKIPSDVEVLITHTPCKNILDKVEEKYRQHAGEDLNVGCQDLLDVIKKRLTKLKLHCSGHIHDNVGVLLQRVSNNRRVLFSNGAVLTNDYTQLVTDPLIITI